jgi:metallo-beta-lactamase class B
MTFKINLKCILKTVVLLLTFAGIENNCIGQSFDAKLIITPLTENFYIYTTFNLYKDHKTPANGLYLVTHDGVLILDTPWDTTQFQPLLDSIEARHHKKAVLCISTHFHGDRTAGLEYYKKRGIKTYTTQLTDEFSKKENYKRAEFLIAKDTTFTLGDYSFSTFYPGPGHTTDNIVIWFDQQKILYGACLIKSHEDDNLGYLGDANTMEYANTVKRVKRKCKNPKYVIVGHGDWSSVKSLDHTLHMAKKIKKEGKVVSKK